MKDRTRAILEIAVRNFIKTGKPITSEYLYDIHDFGIKPAMIRWELNGLSDEGFFYQEHPSGGRFPTDKAYRHFVDTLLLCSDGDDTDEAEEELLYRDIKTFVHQMAEELKVLSVGYDAKGGAMYGSGLHELLAHLETDAKEEIINVVNDFEQLEARLSGKRDWWEDEEIWPRVFVGESPVTRSDHLSVIAGRFEQGSRKILLLSIGPKRMDYEKTVELFRGLKPSRKKKEKSK